MNVGRDQREAAAYHEAGHAVMAYHVGWWVNGEGVEIDPRQYTGLRHWECDRTERRVAAVNLAGWLAEQKHDGIYDLPSDNDLKFCVMAARWPEMGHETDTDDVKLFY